MPSWLVDEIRKVGTKLTQKKKATDKQPRKKIKEGGRNNHLASLAGALRRKGISEDGIIATLRAENKERLDPPLDDETVVAIAKSITRYEPDEPDPQYKLTDVGNAERFVAMFKDEVKYCSVYKKWFIWNGKFWEQDEGTIVEYAIQCVRSIYTYADMLPAGDQRKALIQHAMRSESGNKIKLLITLAAGMKDLAIAPDDWDANPWLLNCQNGTINLKTGKLQPFNKADYITRICNASFDENCTSNRYTSWYDDHVLAPKSELTGDTSKRFLVSGNVVYKLRCAMLHESNPTVVGTEENITHFSLIWRPASSCSRVPIERCIKLDENGAPQQQAISIDIVSLCQDICEAALLYYRKNKEHFSFNYRIISASNRLANLFGYDNEINI